jgi:hypothetical protein
LTKTNQTLELFSTPNPAYNGKALEKIFQMKSYLLESKEIGWNSMCKLTWAGQYTKGVSET